MFFILMDKFHAFILKRLVLHLDKIIVDQVSYVVNKSLVSLYDLIFCHLFSDYSTIILHISIV